MLSVKCCKLSFSFLLCEEFLKMYILSISQLSKYVAVHQIAKLTSDTVEVKGLTQADIKSILFTSPPICISYNR